MEQESYLPGKLSRSIACGNIVYKKKGDKAVAVAAPPSLIDLAKDDIFLFKNFRKIDLLHGADDKDEIPNILRLAFDKEECSERVVRCSGYMKDICMWLYISCMPVKQMDGSVLAVCSFIDVSRQKAIEEELAESKRLEHKAVNKLNQLYDEEIMRLSYCYDDCVCVMRYNISKNRLDCIKGNTMSGLVHAGMSLDECYKIAEDIFGNEVTDGTFYNIFDYKKLEVMFNSGKRSFVLELPFNINRHTYTLWIRFTINMKQNPHTNDIIVFAIEEDITADVLKKAAFQNLVCKEFLLVLCVDIVKNRYFCCFSSEPGIYMDNSKYGVNGDYNATMRKVFYNVPGVPEDKRDEFLENLDPGIIKDNLANASEYIFYYDRTVQGQDKRYKISIRWLDKKHNIVIIAKKDVTDAIREEQKKERQLSDALSDAKKANKAKTVFLSNMSHDMRTPLNGVIGFTNLAIESKSLEEKDRYLKKIRASEDFLIQLINDTLDLGKIESHKMTLTYEDTEWNDLFESVINSVQAEADKKNIELVVNTSKWKYSGKVYVDSLRLKQIFLNLLSNAIKFTPEGGKVEFILECMDKKIKDCNCRVIVRDNGPGMSKGFARYAFDPYSQDETKPVTRMEGTGLGLSIVKNLVDMMGGFIELESEENIGTQFIVCLPVKKSEVPAKDDRQHKESRKKLLKGKNILLCEDHPVNTDLIKIILEHADINVVCAENGREGLGLFNLSAPGHFDAVLMDICMPCMDGLETTKAIRGLDREDAKNVPIIAMTANAYDEDKEKSFAAGMTAYLSKPINTTELFDTLEEQCLKDITGNVRNNIPEAGTEAKAEPGNIDAGGAAGSIKPGTAKAYVDGSYYNGEFAYGAVILHDGEETCLSGKDNNQELAKMHNVAGEIKAAEAAMRYAVQKGFAKITIYHDYEGIAKWCLGEWKAKKEGTQAYKRFYDSVKEKVEIEFVKVKGHSGDKYNDMADMLAKKVLGI